MDHNGSSPPSPGCRPPCTSRFLRHPHDKSGECSSSPRNNQTTAPTVRQSRPPPRKLRSFNRLSSDRIEDRILRFSAAPAEGKEPGNACAKGAHHDRPTPYRRRTGSCSLGLAPWAVLQTPRKNSTRNDTRYH